jgi:arsenite-transporting ATPase
MNVNIQFFVGKGGVGKSTTSALTALDLAHRGYDTLLVSMDPAHNQRDIFQHRFSEKPQPVARNLAITEVDVDHWMASYLKETQSQLKKTYSYQSAFNIQNYYDVLKYSPGLEEHALLLAFKNVLNNEKTRDHILFDMPPTALTMRFFSLPSITLIWLNALLKLRIQIYEKKEILSKIRIGKKEIEQDTVKTRLQALIDDHLHLQQHFTADSTGINLVLNSDRLSFAEAIRIRQKLADIEVDIDRIIVNKVLRGDRLEAITRQFSECSIHRFPLSSGELYGLDALNRYLLEIPLNPGLKIRDTTETGLWSSVS